MADIEAVQILEDGPVNTAVKFTGVIDTAPGEAYNVKLLPATFNTEFVLKYTLPETWRVDFIEFAISDGIQVVLYWDATAPVIMLPIAGRGNKAFKNFGGMQNNARGNPGYTGGIGMSALMAPGAAPPAADVTYIYSIVMDLTKQGPVLS